MNRSLDSREFKLILKPMIFRDRNEGIRKLQKIIQSKVDMLSGNFKPETDIISKFRRTYYLDTINHKLKSKNFFLRIRQNKESSKYTITLKCRHPDRYISALYDLSSPTIQKSKFEEDIIAPHISKFSISAEFEEDQEPEINSLKDLRKIFPGLREHDLGDEKIEKVNNFEAKEISVDLGKITYDNKKDENDKIKTSLNFWYLPHDEGIPLIVEFTYDYSANKEKKGENDKKDKKKISIEEFSVPLVRNTYEFYRSLQENREIVDLKSSKTKTEFVYNEYKR